MNIAVLFIKREDIAESYHKDWEGRDTNDDALSVIKALKELGHNVYPYYADLDLFEKLRKNKKDIDLIFNLCDDGFFSNPELEPHLPAMLDLLGIAYTGGGFLSLALTLKKATVKKILKYHNLPTPKFQVFDVPRKKLKIKFPLIVKPLREDASIGIKDESVVNNERQLRKRVKVVLDEYKQPALVEEFIDGREFNVAVVGDEVMPISEITFDGLPEGKPKIVNYDAKWKEDSIDYKGTKRKCPADIDKRLEKRLIRLALKCAPLFNCRDYFRVDFRVDKNNQPHILEVNQNPDISEDAGLAAMASVKGYTYKDLISKIVMSAAERKKVGNWNEIIQK